MATKKTEEEIEAAEEAKTAKAHAAVIKKADIIQIIPAPAGMVINQDGGDGTMVSLNVVCLGLLSSGKQIVRIALDPDGETVLG